MSNNNTPKFLGEKIRELRVSKGMTQTELSKGLITPSMISQIESGKATPSYKLLCQIADRLEVPVSLLTTDLNEVLSINLRLKTLQVVKERKDYTNALIICEDLLKSEIPANAMREVLFIQVECLVGSGRSDEAIEHLHDLLKKLEDWGEKDEALFATIYNLFGNAYYNKLDLLNAHSYYVQANSYAEKIENLDIAMGYIQYNLGRVHEFLDDTETARMHYNKALEVFNQVSNSPRELANLYYAMGINNSKENNFETADRYLNDAVALYKASNMIDMVQKVKETQAFLVISKNDPLEAKLILLNCCNYFKESGDFHHLAYTYAKLAMLAIDENKYDEANNFLKTIERENDRNNVHPEMTIYWGFIYRVYARYHLVTNNLHEAVKYANKSGVICDKIGMRKEAAKSYQFAIDAEVKQGNHVAALETSQKVIGILQSEGGK